MEIPYEQRQFTVGNIVSESLALYRRFFLRFVALGLIVFGIVDLVTALSTTTDSATGRGLWIVAGVVLGIVGFFWLQGALVMTIDDVRDGRADAGIVETLDRTRERLPYLVGVGFTVGIAVGAVAAVLVLLGIWTGTLWLGILLAVAFALFLATRWAVAPPVVMLEHAGVFAALRRSYALLSGRTWRALWVIVTTSIISGIVSAVVARILSALFSGFVKAWLASAIPNALTAPFLALAWTLMYFHARPLPAKSEEPPA